MRNKVGAAVVSVRRSGDITAYDQINHYMGLTEMVIATSFYWSTVHGNRRGESAQDTEGMATMRTLGRKMAWLLKLIEAGKDTIPLPEDEKHVYMSFIR